MAKLRRKPEYTGAILAERYAAGEGLRALVASTGLSYGAIRMRLLRAGVILRPRGGARVAIFEGVRER